MRLNQPYFGEQWFDKLLFCVSWVIWIMVELLSLCKAVKQRDHLEKMKCKLIPWMFFFGFRLNVCVNLSLCVRTVVCLSSSIKSNKVEAIFPLVSEVWLIRIYYMIITFMCEKSVIILLFTAGIFPVTDNYILSLVYVRVAGIVCRQ